jgi:hypothetical protein
MNNYMTDSNKYDIEEGEIIDMESLINNSINSIDNSNVSTDFNFNPFSRFFLKSETVKSGAVKSKRKKIANGPFSSFGTFLMFFYVN